MSEFRADLHCHSTCSDGSLTPEALVALAVETGLSGLSITDHDTVEAYGRALPAARAGGLKLLSGVELSAVWEKTSVHILGYAFRLDHPSLVGLCQAHITRRTERNRAMVDKLRSRGFAITMEEVEEEAYGEGTVGRPHLAKVLVRKGYVKDVSEAFKRYLGEQGAAYVRGKVFTVEETLAVIKDAGGVAVLAHPMLIKRPRVERKLLALDFDGLEGYYARFDKAVEQPWIHKARERGILVTGGSDFHGEVKPHIPLGCSWTGPEVFDFLYARFLHHHPECAS